MQIGWLVHLGEKLEKLKEREGKYKLGGNERTREVEVTRFSTHGKKMLGQSLEGCLIVRL